MTIPKFERKRTRFMGGECPRHINDLMGRTEYEDECEVEIVKLAKAGDDIWKVRHVGSTGDKGTFYAYGEDMHPHPEAHATNVEAMAHLMEHATTAFTQVFIMEGAKRYADQVLADEAATREQMAHTFISADLMIDSAKEVRDYITAHLAP